MITQFTYNCISLKAIPLLLNSINDNITFTYDSICLTAIPYEVTIWTGTVRGAGTDSNVFLQMYGKKGKTQEISLRNKTDNFEKGQIDKFKVIKVLLLF